MEVDTSHIMKIADEMVTVRIDVQAMTDIEQTLEVVKGGMSKKSFFELLDLPYDVREMSIILMHGINGNNRFENINKRISFSDSNKLLQDHFKSLYQTVKTGPEFKKAQEDFMFELQRAMRKGAGFREAEPITEPLKPT